AINLLQVLRNELRAIVQLQVALQYRIRVRYLHRAREERRALVEPLAKQLPGVIIPQAEPGVQKRRKPAYRVVEQALGTPDYRGTRHPVLRTLEQPPAEPRDQAPESLSGQQMPMSRITEEYVVSSVTREKHASA